MGALENERHNQKIKLEIINNYVSDQFPNEQNQIYQNLEIFDKKLLRKILMTEKLNKSPAQACFKFVKTYISCSIDPLPYNTPTTQPQPTAKPHPTMKCKLDVQKFLFNFPD